MFTSQETQDPESSVVNPGRLTQVLNFLTEVGRRVGISAADAIPVISIKILIFILLHLLKEKNEPLTE